MLILKYFFFTPVHWHQTETEYGKSDEGFAHMRLLVLNLKSLDLSASGDSFHHQLSRVANTIKHH